MAQLQLMQLTCNKTEDLTGPDEAYLRVNGAVIWGPVSMSKGSTQNLTFLPPFPFFGFAVVDLFDQDVGGIFDPDDFLGAVVVSAASLGAGPQAGSFTGDGANYLLVYQVV